MKAANTASNTQTKNTEDKRKKKRKIYSFVMEFWENSTILTVATILCCLMDGFMIYISAIMADSPSLRHIVTTLITTIATVMAADGGMIFIGTFLGRICKITKKVYMVMILFMITAVVLLYSSVAMTSLKAVDIPQTNMTQSYEKNSPTSDTFGTKSASASANTNKKQQKQAAAAKKRVNRQIAWNRILAPISTSAFIFILSMASAKTRRRKIIEDKLDELYQERDELYEQIKQYSGLPTENEMNQSDNEARQNMETRMDVFLTLWMNSILMPLAARFGSPIATDELLRIPQGSKAN